VVTAPALNKQVVTICLVDDDPSVLKATSRLLVSSGWTVESFLDPVEFLRYAETSQPRLVVIDILMPIMNGLEVQSRLRTVSPSTRVIVLTSKDDPSVRSKATAGGASAFFLKPVDDDEFLAGIESALNRQSPTID
jgi:two-component system response regulator HydG